MNNARAEKYTCTTDIGDFRNWDWYKEYQVLLGRQRKTLDIPNHEQNLESAALPLQVGIDFAKWVIKTPEVRDMLYRRFILKNWEDHLEAQLLMSASDYFIRKYEIPGVGTFLGVAWDPIAKVVSGEMASAESPEFRNALLATSFAFVQSKP
jgi:hypothetical protein